MNYDINKILALTIYIDRRLDNQFNCKMLYEDDYNEVTVKNIWLTIDHINKILKREVK